MTGVLMSAALTIASANAHAEFDQSKLYVGGGLGYNSIDSDFGSVDNAIGFQGFAGYNLEDVVELGDGIGFAAEVGYMSTGEFEVKNCTSSVFFNCKIDAVTGLWANAVFDYAVNDQVKAVGRLGLDFGDDDGFMFGFGAGYAINEQMTVRAEYVIRPNINSLQGNFVYFLQ